MTIRRVGVLSVGRMMGALYAVLGLIVGALFSLAALLGMAAAGGQLGPFAVLFGVGAIVFFPIFYGTIGLVGGLIVGLLYNLVAGAVGGIEVEAS